MTSISMAVLSFFLGGAPVECVATVEHGGRVDCVLFMPSKDKLVAGGWNERIVISDLSGRQVRELRKSTPICCMAVSPDGARLAYSGMPSAVYLHEMKVERKEEIEKGLFSKACG